MSATIGRVEDFASELGIPDYSFLNIPHQFKPEERQIYTLDCPSMGSRAGESAFQKQAQEIAQAILACPPHWSGIILVTRKREALLLSERLARLGLQDRVWPFPGSDGTYEPTDKQVAAWERRKKKVPNSIGVAFSLWCGFDGLSEKILIAAKAPFEIWGSPGSYEAAWRQYDMNRYRWVSAVRLAQGLGRTRRGRAQDYDLNGEFNGFVAIADQSWKQLKKYLPQDTLDSVVEV
jgi:hypothetical protein